MLATFSCFYNFIYSAWSWLVHVHSFYLIAVTTNIIRTSFHFTDFYRLSPDFSVLSKAFQLTSYKILYFDNKMNISRITLALGKWNLQWRSDIAAYLLNKSTAVKTLIRWKLTKKKELFCPLPVLASIIVFYITFVSALPQSSLGFLCLYFFYSNHQYISCKLSSVLLKFHKL